ncbi:MAG: carboxypeptidase regulatory-like domain-containing protein [Gemmatimonadales bacterium]
MTRSGITTVGLLGLAALAGPAAAQTGQIEGSVTDTLGRRRLSGARIEVEGIARTVMSDAGGRFVFDSVPAGSHRITFRHPVLDTLGFAAATVTVDVPAGGTARAALGIPSGRSFMRLCPLPNGPVSESAVFGVVRNAVSVEPLAEAPVRVSWATIVADQTLGVRRLIQTRVDTTDALGRYLICSLPPGEIVTVMAFPAGFEPVTGDVTLRTEEAVPLPLSAAPAGSVADAVLQGRVVGGDRRPMAGADVWVIMSGGAESSVARTDSAGRFSLSGLKPGTGTVAVRRIGSSPSTRTVALASGSTTNVQLTLADQALTLPEISVEAKKIGRAAQFGFNERRQMGSGKFLDEDAIARLPAADAAALLRQLPNVRVRDEFGTVVLQNNSLRGSVSGGSCSMELMVDGIVTPPDVLLATPKEQIEAVEVYNNGEDVPLEFRRSTTGCGAVLVWTKR